MNSKRVRQEAARLCLQEHPDKDLDWKFYRRGTVARQWVGEETRERFMELARLRLDFGLGAFPT